MDLCDQHNCAMDYSLKFMGFEEVFGRQVARLVMDLKDSVNTYWLDPALGCERLQSMVELKQADGTL